MTSRDKEIWERLTAAELRHQSLEQKYEAAKWWFRSLALALGGIILERVFSILWG